MAATAERAAASASVRLAASNTSQPTRIDFPAPVLGHPGAVERSFTLGDDPLTALDLLFPLPCFAHSASCHTGNVPVTA